MKIYAKTNMRNSANNEEAKLSLFLGNFEYGFFS
jgi:hypothetical protein